MVKNALARPDASTMSGNPAGASGPPPPKKRSFFKKAAWQTAVRPEGDKEKDIFSHSGEYSDIVAEDVKRRQEEKDKKDAERRRKVDEERERKKRKVSTEERVLPGSGSGGSGRARRRGSHGLAPDSPLSAKAVPDADSLSARYDVLTSSSNSIGSLSSKVADVIDLGDDDEDEKDEAMFNIPAQQVMPHLPSRRAPSDDLEEVEDPRLAEIAARARARAAAAAEAANRPSPSSTFLATSSSQRKKEPSVQLLITSELEDSNPLLVKISVSGTIEKPRKAWCALQKYSNEKTEGIFFTWKRGRIYDSTTIKRLGVNVDEDGAVTVEGSSDIYGEDNLPKVHVEAWTEELFRETKKREADDAAERRRVAEPLKAVKEEEPIDEPEEQTQRIRLILKAKGQSDVRISVKPDTTFHHLSSAYKVERKLPSDQPITLMFDGDRLRPMDVVGDSEIEDLDCVEVLFK